MQSARRQILEGKISVSKRSSPKFQIMQNRRCIVREHRCLLRIQHTKPINTNVAVMNNFESKVASSRVLTLYPKSVGCWLFILKGGVLFKGHTQPLPDACGRFEFDGRPDTYANDADDVLFLAVDNLASAWLERVNQNILAASWLCSSTRLRVPCFILFPVSVEGHGRSLHTGNPVMDRRQLYCSKKCKTSDSQFGFFFVCIPST